MDRRKVNLGKFSIIHSDIYGEKNDGDNEEKGQEG
jgi:hypothetical protein